MSKVYCFAVYQQGIYAVSDTMALEVDGDKIISENDNFRKLHKLSDNILFASAGDAGYADVILQHTKDLIDIDEYEYPEDIATSLSIRYGSLMPRPKISYNFVELIIAGYSPLAMPQIFVLKETEKFSIHPALEENRKTDEYAGFWKTIGVPGHEKGFKEDIDAIIRDLDLYGKDVKNRLISRAQQSIKYFSEKFIGISSTTHVEIIEFPHYAPK